MQSIYHLAYEDEWNEALETGEYVWSTRDQSIADVDFLHASFEDQTLGVAQRFYSDVDAPLVLLRLEADALARAGLEVRVEPAIAGQADSEKFPHVYGGNLPVTAVAAAEPYTVPGS